jgi:hypothetical protein
MRYEFPEEVQELMVSKLGLGCEADEEGMFLWKNIMEKVSLGSCNLYNE